MINFHGCFFPVFLIYGLVLTAFDLYSQWVTLKNIKSEGNRVLRNATIKTTLQLVIILSQWFLNVLSN